MEAADARARDPLDRLPPQTFFLVSAVFHYLGPSMATIGVAIHAEGK